jgi:hypothetical protein
VPGWASTAPGPTTLMALCFPFPFPFAGLPGPLGGLAVTPGRSALTRTGIRAPAFTSS